MLGLWSLFVLSLPLADLLLFPSVLVGAGQPSTFLAVLLFTTLVLTQPRTSFRILSRDPHSRLFLGFLAVAAASVFMSAAAPLQQWKNEFLWIKSLKQCLQLAVCFCCFALPLLYLNTPVRFWRAVRLYALTLAFVAVYGVLEMLHYLNIDTGMYPVLADAVHFGSFFGSAAAPNLVFLPSLRGFPRLRLLASEPSMAGNYLLSVLPLGFFVAVRRGEWHWWTIACAGLAALVLTFSLGSWIAAAISVAVALVLLLRDRRNAPKIAALSVVAAGLVLGAGTLLDSTPSVVSVPGEVMGRLARSEGDISVSGRMLENRTAWEIFADYPLLGVGIGNWVFHYPGRMSDIPNTYVYFREQVTESTGFQRAAGINNLFLRLLCETGALGFAVFVLFLLSLWRTIVRLVKASPVVRPLAVALAMVCGALMFHFNSLSAFDKRYWWFLFGLVAAAGPLFLTRPRYAMVLKPAEVSRQDLAEVTP